MTRAIARVHPVHSAPVGRQPSHQANRLGLWVRLLLSTPIFIIHYYYSARKVILTLPSARRVEGWVNLCMHKGAQPVTKATYHSCCRDKHNCRRWIRSWDLTHCSHHTTRDYYSRAVKIKKGYLHAILYTVPIQRKTL